MTTPAVRPVQLADVARRTRHAVSGSFSGPPPQHLDLDTAVRVVRAPDEPAAALVHVTGAETAPVPYYLREPGYDVTELPAVPGAEMTLLVRCGKATDSRVFDYVLGRCDVCWFDHDYDKELSEQLMRILRELIPRVDPDDYFEDLESFSDGHRDRMKQLHEQLGHGSRFHLNGRYVLARQPETWIILERAATARDAFAQAFADDALLPHLRDLAAAWEDTARQHA